MLRGKCNINFVLATNLRWWHSKHSGSGCGWSVTDKWYIIIIIINIFCYGIDTPNAIRHCIAWRKLYFRMNWINIYTRLCPAGHWRCNIIPEIQTGAICVNSIILILRKYIFRHLFSNPLKIWMKKLEEICISILDRNGWYDTIRYCNKVQCTMCVW